MEVSKKRYDEELLVGLDGAQMERVLQTMSWVDFKMLKLEEDKRAAMMRCLN